MYVVKKCSLSAKIQEVITERNVAERLVND